MNSNRISRLQRNLRAPELIKKPENLAYLLGCQVMHGYLLVKPKGPPGQVVFFGDGLESIPGISRTDRLKNLGKYLALEKEIFLEDEFTFAESKYISQKTRSFGLRTGRLKIRHQKSQVDYQRQVKEAAELARIRRSMEIVSHVFKKARREIKKPGMTEARLAAFIEEQGRRAGAEDLAFPAIAASGANSSVPHHKPAAKKIRKGEPVILDFGFKYQGYCSDFTRTLFLGHAPARLALAYAQVEKAYLQSMAFARPGRTAGRVYERAVEVLSERRLEKFFIHSLGHGTGLEIHELPNLSPGSRDLLAPAMVFSIEPGVYLPKIGGIRIEDLVYLTKAGAKKFIFQPTALSENIL